MIDSKHVFHKDTSPWETQTGLQDLHIEKEEKNDSI